MACQICRLQLEATGSTRICLQTSSKTNTTSSGSDSPSHEAFLQFKNTDRNNFIPLATADVASYNTQMAYVHAGAHGS
jgi:hypothetical protein